MKLLDSTLDVVSDSSVHETAKKIRWILKELQKSTENKLYYLDHISRSMLENCLSSLKF